MSAQYPPSRNEKHSCPNFPTLSYLNFLRLVAASSLHSTRGAHGLFSSDPTNVPSDPSERVVAPYVQYCPTKVGGRPATGITNY